MAWYPGARKLELQPESDSQPAIRPTQFIVHSIVAPWDEVRTYEYWRDSTSLESHFGLDYDGSMGQYIGTETRADANYKANRWPDGTGAVSIETASNTKASDAWTPEQTEALIKLGVWLHRTHGIPLRLCRTAQDPGMGYHSLHPSWSVSGTACPGPARIKQFREHVFPGIVARAAGVEEDDVTPEEIEKIAARAAELTERRLLRTDGKYKAPTSAADYNADPADSRHWWSGQTMYEALINSVRDTAAKVDALEATGLTEAQMARVADLVADRLSARLAK